MGGELTPSHSGAAAPELGDGYRTRPGTAMVGPYSVHQMDDFYSALERGEVKATGVMNYVQHLVAAQRCPKAAVVVDVCCGRGLQLPVLYCYAPQVSRYIGLDIAEDNLREARQRVADLEREHGQAFPVDLVVWDVAEPWPDLPPADVMVYTSALEHLPRRQGEASLRHAAAALAPGGRLFLSTPNTTGPHPRPLQHRVHVYEWDRAELQPLLEKECGLQVEQVIGLIPSDDGELETAARSAYGDAAVVWVRDLRALLPAAFLDVVLAAALPSAAKELLYVCRRVPS